MINAPLLRGGKARLVIVGKRQLIGGLDYRFQIWRRTLATAWKDVAIPGRKLPYDEEALAVVRVPKMVGRKQAVATARHVGSRLHVITELRKRPPNDPPRAPAVVTLEVAHIFQEDVLRAMAIQDRKNVVKEGSTRLVEDPVLGAG